MDDFGDDHDNYFADIMKTPPTVLGWVGIAACIAFWSVLVGVML